MQSQLIQHHASSQHNKSTSRRKQRQRRKHRHLPLVLSSLTATATALSLSSSAPPIIPVASAFLTPSPSHSTHFAQRMTVHDPLKPRSHFPSSLSSSSISSSISSSTYLSAVATAHAHPPLSSSSTTSSSSSSCDTISSSFSLLENNKKLQLQSYLSPNNISGTSNTNGMISIRSNTRYGGRANGLNHLIHVKSEDCRIHVNRGYDAGNGAGGILGFDLKMVASSSSSSSSASSSPSHSPLSSSASRSSARSTQTKQSTKKPYTGFGIDELKRNQNNLSPIKKQVISNLLQSSNSNSISATSTTRSSSSSPTSVNVASGNNSRRNLGMRHQSKSSSSSSSSSWRMTNSNVIEKELIQETDTKSTIATNCKDSVVCNNVVPMWFPYIPTRKQIESLKNVELKAACQERGLIKSGNKNQLQQRLLEWTHNQHRRRVLERNAYRSSSSQPLHDAIDQAVHSNDSFDSFLSSSFGAFSAASSSGVSAASTASASSLTRRNKYESKEEHESNIKNGDVTGGTEGIGEEGVDTIEPLINRRKALLRSKHFSFSKNKKGVLGFDINTNNEDDEEDYDDDYYDVDNFLSTPPPTEDYLNDLTKTFHESKSVVVLPENDISEMSSSDNLNNYQLKELYLEAKHADQSGNIQQSKALLQKLIKLTPKDTRVIRRLARLEVQENNYHKGREILQDGLRALPNDSHLLQGLGQLERRCGNLNKARQYFKEAIQTSPSIPNPYHALGTLEHSQGNIRAATTVLRMGLKQCPSNHRLHHALGDLYREAKMLDMAEKAYLRGLKCLDVESSSSGRALNWSRSFFYTAMSYLSYDRGDVDICKMWLRKSTDRIHNRMHSQGWLGLAQLEESEGHIDEARRVYREGLSIYEKHRGMRKMKTSSKSMLSGGGRGSQVKPSKMGDQWLNVYMSFARFEEKYGDYDSTNNVYSQAATAFPNDWNILVSWSRLQMSHQNHERARTLLELACRRAGNRDSEPYRIYAEFEMSLRDYNRARSILFLGAQSVSESSNGSLHNDKFARLHHSWAICEWHLGNLDRTEVLFDHSLRLIDAGIRGSEARSMIFLSIARFLFSARQDYSLAQHCVSLSLTENTRSQASWILWSNIAAIMGNEKLSESCKEEAEKLIDQRIERSDELGTVNNQKMNQMLRRAPWHHKIFEICDQKSWHESIKFPDVFISHEVSDLKCIQ